MFVPEVYKYSVRTRQINKPATTVVEKVKYHAQSLSTHCFSVNSQYVVYHRRRRSDLLHFLITQPLHPSALKPGHEEGDTHPLNPSGDYWTIVEDVRSREHGVVIWKINSAPFYHCSELRNDARPLGGDFCWDFALTASFSRLRASISCNTVVFFLGFVCKSGVVPRVKCATGDKPTGTEERDEDGINSFFGLRSD